MPSIVAVLFAAGSLVGCAKAGDGANNDSSDDVTDVTDDNSDGPPVDARVDSAPEIDAQDIDAAPQSVTLAQTDSIVADGASLACGVNGYTAENSWYRVFDLAQLGITGDLTVSQVAFGIEQAAGAQTVDVKLGIYTGTAGGASLDLALVTPLATTTVAVPAASLIVQTVPMTAVVPAGSKLMVEVASPNHQGTTTNFYLGTTTAPETSPSYLRAPTCNLSVPGTSASIGAGAAIITVTGSY